MFFTVLVVSQDEAKGSNLSQYIQNELDLYSERLDFQECFEYQEEDSKYKALYLWDYRGNEVDYFWWVKKQVKKGERDATFFAVYNVPQDSAIEDQLIEFGVQGIFYEGQDLTILKKGINTILGGELWYPRKIMTQYIKKKFKNNDKLETKTKPHLLTSREEEILALIAAGKTNIDIAETLYISPSTVKTHIYNLFQKIHVQNRVQAALWAASKVNKK